MKTMNKKFLSVPDFDVRHIYFLCSFCRQDKRVYVLDRPTKRMNPTICNDCNKSFTKRLANKIINLFTGSEK